MILNESPKRVLRVRIDAYFSLLGLGSVVRAAAEFLRNSLKAYNRFIHVPATTPTLAVYQKQRFPLSMTSAEPLFVGSRGDSGVKCIAGTNEYRIFIAGTEEEDLTTVTS